MNTNRKLRPALGWMLGIMTAVMVGGWTLARAQARADEAIAADYRQAISSYTEERHLEWMQALEQGGLEGLMERVRQNQLAPPAIPSKLYAEEILQEESSRQAAARAREFGLKVLEALEAYAPTLQAAVTADVRMGQFEFFNELCQWLMQTNGYGNAIVAMEARRMGAVPAVYYAVDPAATDAGLEQMLSLAPTLPWAPDLQAQRRILNAEAGEEVIGDLYGEADLQRRQISLPWRRFADDNPIYQYRARSGQSTQLEMWDHDQHFPIAQGGGVFTYPREVRDFLQFRLTVGYFPTDPPEWWVERRGAWQAYTGLEAAMVLAIDKSGLTGEVAASTMADVYQRATSGTYLDTSSAIRALQERERQRRAAAEAGAAKN